MEAKAIQYKIWAWLKTIRPRCINGMSLEQLQPLLFVIQPQGQAELTPSSRGINHLSSMGGLRHDHLSGKWSFRLIWWLEQGQFQLHHTRWLLLN